MNYLQKLNQNQSSLDLMILIESAIVFIHLLDT